MKTSACGFVMFMVLNCFRGLQFYYHETELFAAVTTDEDAEPVEEK